MGYARSISNKCEKNILTAAWEHEKITGFKGHRMQQRSAVLTGKHLRAGTPVFSASGGSNLTGRQQSYSSILVKSVME